MSGGNGRRQRMRLNRFYTAEAHLSQRFERVGRRLGVRGETADEVRAWQRELDANRHEFLSSTCHHLSLKGEPLGQAVAGMWTWDLMRLLDYAQTRPEVEGSRLGCAGLSGGGLQTLFLAALDQRVRAAVVS